MSETWSGKQIPAVSINNEIQLIYRRAQQQSGTTNYSQVPQTTTKDKIA
jgi:hypothetical protein